MIRINIVALAALLAMQSVSAQNIYIARRGAGSTEDFPSLPLFLEEENLVFPMWTLFRIIVWNE